MEVQIINPLAIRAAATLANAGYTASVFQVRREGGDARVSGTNGYASISVLVPAKFNRWPDGKSLTFSGAAVRSMMRGIGRSLKTANFAKLSFSGGFVSASTEGEGTATQTKFDVSRDSFFDKLAGYDWTKGAAKSNVEGGRVNPHNMKLASQAFEQLALNVPVKLEPGSDGRTYTMTAEVGAVRACAVIVRSHES